MLKVAIIEDNRLVREGLTEMLNKLPDVDVVLATPAFDAIKMKEVNPGLVLVDIGQQGFDCLHIAGMLREEMAQCHVVVMDLLPVHEEIAQLVNVGVAGFILKDASVEDFVSTIRSVANGQRVLPQQMTGTLFSQISRGAVQRGRAVALAAVRMTHRRGEVIGLIAEGMSNKEIAHSLHIASDTVKSHVRNVMDKLALHSRLQIAAYANQRAA